ncbi:MAG TPA: Ig-like domain-containing protein, partial [Candidatus Krumholzibacteria bacterium]|nr:Ig-like domain-containing protein [Candidatus Krumholzibacteria bacterium]
MTTIDQDRRKRDEGEKEERRRRARLLLARLRHRIDQLCGVVRTGSELIQTAQDIAADIRKITDSPELRDLLSEPLQAGLVRASDALDRADQYLAQADSYAQMPSAICSETLDAIDAADQALQGEIPGPYLRRLWNDAVSRVTRINHWKAGLVAMAVATAATISGVLLAYLGGGGPSYPPVGGVYILSAPSAMEIGDQAQLQSYVEGEGGEALNESVTVVWSSSDESVLVVSDSGLVEALGPGEASVFAVANGVNGEAAIRVTLPQPVATLTAAPPATPTSFVASPTPSPSPAAAGLPPLTVATVDVYPAVLALNAGEDGRLQAIPRDASGATVLDAHIVWESGDPGIVTVTQDGIVHGVGIGSTRVVASAGSV